MKPESSEDRQPGSYYSMEFYTDTDILCHFSDVSPNNSPNYYSKKYMKDSAETMLGGKVYRRKY